MMNEDDFKISLGRNIRETRKAKGYTSRIKFLEAFEECGDIMDENLLGKYENGDRRISSYKLAVIAFALGVKTDDLIPKNFSSQDSPSSENAK